MKNERKIGAFLSYIATVLNSAVTIFLTPYILAQLGDAEYGIYRSISALTGQLALVSIGIGTITTVFVARYRARTDETVGLDQQNFLAMALAAGFLISTIVLAIGMFVYLGIDDLYSKTYTAAQISLTKKLYIILVINVALYLFRDVFVGIVNGYERFMYSGSVKVLRIVFRIVLILILLRMGYKSIGLVFCDLFISLFLIFSDIVFCLTVLKVKIRFHHFDSVLFKSMFTFSAGMVLQTIVNQVNQNLDSVILGAMITPERVAVYSLALTIYVAFNSLSGSISTLFTAEASRMVQQKATTQQLQQFVTKVGRYQFLVIAMILGGFIAIGREFVQVWAGAARSDVYYLTLILMAPMSVANLLSGANSVLDGYMKRMGRSIILFFMAVINVVSSIVMIHFVDYWGAALGTAFSVMIGQIFLMGMYYKKIFEFQIFLFLRDVFDGIVPVMAAAVVFTLPIRLLPLSASMLLLVRGGLFVLLYAVAVYRFGMRENERSIVTDVVHRISSKRRR